MNQLLRQMGYDMFICTPVLSRMQYGIIRLYFINGDINGSQLDTIWRYYF